MAPDGLDDQRERHRLRIGVTDTALGQRPGASLLRAQLGGELSPGAVATGAAAVHASPGGVADSRAPVRASRNATAASTMVLSPSSALPSPADA